MSVGCRLWSVLQTVPTLQVLNGQEVIQLETSIGGCIRNFRKAYCKLFVSLALLRNLAVFFSSSSCSTRHRVLHCLLMLQVFSNGFEH